MKVVTMIILLVCVYSSFVPHKGKGGLVEWVELFVRKEKCAYKPLCEALMFLMALSFINFQYSKITRELKSTINSKIYSFCSTKRARSE